MNWQHLLSVTEDPLLVRVGSEVVGRSVVARHVVEQVLVLRGGVLGPVGGREPKDGHEGGRAVLHVLDEVQGPVGDQVREVVALVVVLVVLQTAVVVEGVVVVPGVLDQPQPVAPAWRDVSSVVLVEVFAQVGSQVAAGLEVSGEGSLLVTLPPAGGAAVLVIGEHVMVVHVQT